MSDANHNPLIRLQLQNSETTYVVIIHSYVYSCRIVNHLYGDHRGPAPAGSELPRGERALDLRGMAAGEVGPEDVAAFVRRKVKPPHEEDLAASCYRHIGQIIRVLTRSMGVHRSRNLPSCLIKFLATAYALILHQSKSREITTSEALLL
jgi:hypothetical protein